MMGQRHTLMPVHYRDRHAHAARDMLGFWLQNGLAMTMTHLPHMGKKKNCRHQKWSYIKKRKKQKNRCMYTQTYNWNTSGMIHKKLLAVACFCKTGELGCKGGEF